MQEFGLDLMALWPYFLIGMIGITGHWLKTMVSLHQSGDVHVTLLDYLRDQRYQTALAILTTLVGIAFLAEANQLTFVAAFLTGYTIDSSSEMFGGKVNKVYDL